MILFWDTANGSIPSGFSALSGQADKFVLGAGGSIASGGYADACILGHFHAGDTKYGGNHGHRVVYSTDSDPGNFDSSGGFVIDEGPMTGATGFAGEASGSPPRGQQVQRAQSGDAVDAASELGRHYHTLQTWGELYDNDQWNPSASYLSWPTIASAFPSTDNKALTSDPTGRNIPPYIKLTYIKKD